jgi:hypothetical protein
VLAQSEVVGPQVNLPGSQQLAPVFFGLCTFVLLVALAISLFVRHRRSPKGQRPAPVVSVIIAVFAVAALVTTIVRLPPSFSSPEFPPLERLFPEDAVFYRTATDLPVAADSDRWLAAMGDTPLLAGFGDQPVDGIVFGIPFNPVTPRAPMTDVRFRRDPSGSYGGGYPVADPAYIESMPTYGSDNHYVAIDLERDRMWELLGTVVWFGQWEADTGAVWDLDSLQLGEWKTMASWLPLMPGVITYDEVAAGRIDHVVHAASPAMSATEFVWPSLGTDGPNQDPDAPPMGAWLRLRDDVDLSGLGPQATVIAEALQTYGLLLSDTSGGNFALRGTPDGRFDRGDLSTLGSIGPTDFEVVDASGVMVAPDSMAARQP